MKYAVNVLLATTLSLGLLSGCMAESTTATSTAAAATTNYTNGKQYATLSASIPTQAPSNQVEVTEIFWYGCPHCYELEPTINEYLKTKPANVYFNRVPATLGEKWTFHAKLFYVGKMLDSDGSKGIHTKIFDALHKQGRRIDNDDAIKRFFEAQGFTAAQVDTVLKSMELQTSLNYAKEVTNKSGIQSVPSLIVGGKYLTGPAMMSEGSKLIDVLNYLVNKK
ncbi:thiol:disulfide interchange protein DsbA/DsbL [Thiolinea disciformis]|uniref:thiol:disulfide interchange protein DsbA/DsbL n=1 Tax=Thiolinea disciformis TaxID=125614 RepID=UPI00035EB856|nr:thiol:disulfide interchange protein DsbA/DsbL [Thiolinea disciformis]